jgi:Mn2+/Fe2+ NRAMP family transporter
VKSITKISLGILTSVGGYLEAGSLGTALQAGANFQYELLWAIAIGTVCIAFLIEMSGRLAAVSHHTVVAAVRERFGFSFHVWPFSAQLLVDLLVLASEIAGASLALSLMTGVPMRAWAIPVAFLIWALLWGGTFATIENGVALLGLVTLCFVVAAWRLGPDWHQALRGLVPHRPALDAGLYAYQAISIVGATISPYMVTFYSSGAIEEKWTTKDVMPNRIVAALGMSFGSLVSMSVVVVAALVLGRRGIEAETYQQAAGVLSLTFGRWGFWLFCASLFVGCVGAALELALDLSYLVAQTFGWNWGEDLRPAQEARFPLIYTGALALALLPALLGVDPLEFTLFSMAATVVALPIVVGPLIVVMNDKQYLKSHTNGWITNIAVTAIVVLAFILAVLAIPVQIAGT